MTDDRPDFVKRRFLRRATVILGGVGAVFVAAPFVLSMNPGARAKAEGGPVEVDIGRLEDGQALTIEWRRKPVWIVQRTAEMLAGLERNDGILADPASRVASQQPPYALNPYRSIKPEILVLVGICTHLGCVPAQHLAPGTASGLGDEWPGGWFCHCHGSKFDFAGRVFKNVPASTNLVVLPYAFLSDTRLLIGASPVDVPKAG